jgi:hypothetical protein
MMRQILSKIAMGAALLGALLTFVSIPQPADARCPRVLYQACVLEPIYIAPGGTRATVFTNACLAHARGWTILHRGACLGPNCPFIVEPVCAINPFSHAPMTYPNLCIAEVDNAVFVHNGPC